MIPNGNSEIIINARSTLNIFSKLGSSLFVSVIGLQTGASFKDHSKKSVSAFLIGALMSLSRIATMLLIALLDKSISYASLLGILCGALTSTPGLSSICERIGNGSEDAVMDYVCSYLFGVILAVLFAQLFAKEHTRDKAPLFMRQNIKSNTTHELILICLTALLGNILGNIKIANITFDTTVCTLAVGLFIGYIYCKAFKPDKISSQYLNASGNLGSALFFAGTGFSTGSQNFSFDIRAILYRILITLTAIICGLVMCKLLIKKQPLHQGFIIAGGMTSSPAYASLANSATDASVTCFSFSYFGAWLTLIVAIQIII